MRHRLNTSWETISTASNDILRISLQTKRRKGRALFSFEVSKKCKHLSYYGKEYYTYDFVERIYDLNKLNRKYNTDFRMIDIPKLNLSD